MRIRQRTRTHRRGGGDGTSWLSFSDLMSSLLLIFVLIMFYIMYQYFDMYEVNMAEIARQQYDLDQANADLEEKSAKLTDAENQMVAQQVRLNAAQRDLETAEAVLSQQQTELAAAQSLLSDKEAQIAAQQTELDQQKAILAQQQQTMDAQQLKLNAQQTTLDEQQAKLTAAQVELDKKQQTVDQQQAQLASQQQTLTSQQAQLGTQQQTMDEQQAQLDAQQQTMAAQQAQLAQQQQTMDAQQMKLNEQQQALLDQQLQIEALVGLKTRIITSLSEALRAANISAQVDPTNGSIALKSDVLFETNKFDLTDAGKRFIDRFLPVYLDVLLGSEYEKYVTEIIIEGHTDSAGDYISNLQLSQRRALAVASYVLSDGYTGISAQKKELLRDLATANGRSESDPVVDMFGNEDMDASRRVVFKFRMTDEQMIQQLKYILENE